MCPVSLLRVAAEVDLAVVSCKHEARAIPLNLRYDAAERKLVDWAVEEEPGLEPLLF